IKCSGWYLWLFPIVMLILTTLSSRLIQCFISQQAKLSILIWQAIGFLTVFGLWFYGIIRNYFVNWQNCQMPDEVMRFCQDLNIQHYVQLNSEVVRVFSAVLIFILFYNLIFALLLRRFIKNLP
ncbi:MAG TPA: hypothetical protein VEX64_11215, partial [Pyrinomonadaceae bacterium]|nr:hypothetical protein [Pyrinomonadaceae bacterium]